jgi:hypothetical protein
MSIDSFDGPATALHIGPPMVLQAGPCSHYANFTGRAMVSFRNGNFQIKRDISPLRCAARLPPPPALSASEAPRLQLFSGVPIQKSTGIPWPYGTTTDRSRLQLGTTATRRPPAETLRLFQLVIRRSALRPRHASGRRSRELLPRRSRRATRWTSLSILARE